MATFQTGSLQQAGKSIGGIGDVFLSTPITNNQALMYEASTGHWVNKTVTGDGGATTLPELTDVNFPTGLVNGQVLTYEGGQWINKQGVSTLEGLTDVTLTTPANGQVLTYNGTHWVNQPTAPGGATSLAELTDVSITNPQNDAMLVYNAIQAKWFSVTPTFASNYAELGDVSTTGRLPNTMTHYNGTTQRYEPVSEILVDSTTRNIVMESPKISLLATGAGEDVSITSVNGGNAVVQGGYCIANATDGIAVLSAQVGTNPNPQSGDAVVSGEHRAVLQVVGAPGIASTIDLRPAAPPESICLIGDGYKSTAQYNLDIAGVPNAIPTLSYVEQAINGAGLGADWKLGGQTFTAPPGTAQLLGSISDHPVHLVRQGTPFLQASSAEVSLLATGANVDVSLTSDAGRVMISGSAGAVVRSSSGDAGVSSSTGDAYLASNRDIKFIVGPDPLSIVEIATNNLTPAEYATRAIAVDEAVPNILAVRQLITAGDPPGETASFKYAWSATAPLATSSSGIFNLTGNLLTMNLNTKDNVYLMQYLVAIFGYQTTPVGTVLEFANASFSKFVRYVTTAPGVGIVSTAPQGILTVTVVQPANESWTLFTEGEEFYMRIIDRGSSAIAGTMENFVRRVDTTASTNGGIVFYSAPGVVTYDLSTATSMRINLSSTQGVFERVGLRKTVRPGRTFAVTSNPTAGSSKVMYDITVPINATTGPEVGGYIPVSAITTDSPGGGTATTVTQGSLVTISKLGATVLEELQDVTGVFDTGDVLVYDLNLPGWASQPSTGLASNKVSKGGDTDGATLKMGTLDAFAVNHVANNTTYLQSDAFLTRLSGAKTSEMVVGTTTAVLTNQSYDVRILGGGSRLLMSPTIARIDVNTGTVFSSDGTITRAVGGKAVELTAGTGLVSCDVGGARIAESSSGNRMEVQTGRILAQSANVEVFDSNGATTSIRASKGVEMVPSGGSGGVVTVDPGGARMTNTVNNNFVEVVDSSMRAVINGLEAISTNADICRITANKESVIGCVDANTFLTVNVDKVTTVVDNVERVYADANGVRLTPSAGPNFCSIGTAQQTANEYALTVAPIDEAIPNVRCVKNLVETATGNAVLNGGNTTTSELTVGTLTNQSVVFVRDSQGFLTADANTTTVSGASAVAVEVNGDNVFVANTLSTTINGGKLIEIINNLTNTSIAVNTEGCALVDNNGDALRWASGELRTDFANNPEALVVGEENIILTPTASGLTSITIGTTLRSAQSYSAMLRLTPNRDSNIPNFLTVKEYIASQRVFGGITMTQILGAGLPNTTPSTIVPTTPASTVISPISSNLTLAVINAGSTMHVVSGLGAVAVPVRIRYTVTANTSSNKREVRYQLRQGVNTGAIGEGTLLAPIHYVNNGDSGQYDTASSTVYLTAKDNDAFSIYWINTSNVDPLTLVNFSIRLEKI